MKQWRCTKCGRFLQPGLVRYDDDRKGHWINQTSRSEGEWCGPVIHQRRKGDQNDRNVEALRGEVGL